MTLVDVGLLVLAVPVLAATGYLCLLALMSRRVPVPSPVEPRFRFDVVVPAHDEEAGIAATVASLLGLDYPKDLFRVIVVADNCSDQTAARAAAAGAVVWPRSDPERRGKGHALAHAFERCLAEGASDALVVIDADTLVSPNLLRAFDVRLQAGAWALQADYRVRNPEASWRTRLMAIAFALFHEVRSLARERLKVSCGLRGNGMCFSAQLLREVPYCAFSIVEDVELGLRLGEAGHRIHYVAEANVRGEMVGSERASRSQRLRWEGGRFALLRAHGPALAARALRRRDPVLLDLAIDLFIPPLTYVALACAVGLAASLAASVLAGRLTSSLAVWGTSGLMLGIYVARGWRVSGSGARGLLDLALAPIYMLWKIVLVLGRNRRSNDAWVRTARQEGQSGGPSPRP